MGFAFSWEFPAAVIGAAAVVIAALAVLVMIVRTHHGPSHREIAVVAVLAAASLWTWNTRLALAQRFFPEGSDVLEERIALQLSHYDECAFFVSRTGHGRDDGATCTVRVLSARGRWIDSEPPRKSFESPCDVTAVPEVRTWTFAKSALQDWCAR